MDGASIHRAERVGWEVSVQRADVEVLEDEDQRFWLAIPTALRAAATWELSVELFSLAARNGGFFDEVLGEWIQPGGLYERRLPRTAFRVTRR